MKHCSACESQVRARLLDQLGGLCVRCLVRFVIGEAEEENLSSERETQVPAIGQPYFEAESGS